MKSIRTFLSFAFPLLLISSLVNAKISVSITETFAPDEWTIESPMLVPNLKAGQLYSTEFKLENITLYSAQDLSTEAKPNPQRVIKSKYRRSARIHSLESSNLDKDQKSKIKKLLSKAQKLSKARNFKFKYFNDLNNYHFVYNFAHGHKIVNGEKETFFWLALIPKNVTVKDASIQEQKFIPGFGAHAQVRYNLNSNILIVPHSALEATEISDLLSFDYKQNDIFDSQFRSTQAEEFYNKQRATLIPGSLIYSMAGIQTETGSQEWTSIDGLAGEYVITHQLGSSAYFAGLQILHDKNFIREYPVNSKVLNPQVLFKKMFPYLASIGSEIEIYNTVFYNCQNSLFRLLNLAISSANQLNLNVFNSYRLTEELVAKKIVDLSQQNQPVNVQLDQKLSDAEKDDHNISELAKQEAIFDAKGNEIASLPIIDRFATNLAYFVLKNKINRHAINGFFELVKSGANSSGGAPSLETFQKMAQPPQCQVGADIQGQVCYMHMFFASAVQVETAEVFKGAFGSPIVFISKISALIQEYAQPPAQETGQE